MNSLLSSDHTNFRIVVGHVTLQCNQYFSKTCWSKIFFVGNAPRVVPHQLKHHQAEHVHRGEGRGAGADAVHPSQEREGRHGRIPPRDQVLDELLRESHRALLDERELPNHRRERLSGELAGQVLPVHREGDGPEGFGVAAGHRRGRPTRQAIALAREVRPKDLSHVEFGQGQSEPYRAELPPRVDARRQTEGERHVVGAPGFQPGELDDDAPDECVFGRAFVAIVMKNTGEESGIAVIDRHQTRSPRGT
mmetsp:Transcript_41692/g.88838  ORF Transcript_41692/g.88838 Transcript_41692/m.88838 type:complete len:250 (-) Transcript_41692:30-779(-)